MKNTSESQGSRKIAVVQGFEWPVRVVHLPELIEHVLRNAFENLLDFACVWEILLIIDSGKLPKKRDRLIRYSPKGRRRDE